MINTKGYCSPSTIDIYDKHKTCLSIDHLKNLCIEYNHNFPNDPINIEKKKSALLLSKELDKKLCGSDEMCWVNHDLFQKKDSLRNILTKSFRPSIPRKRYDNKYEQLNTDDIDKVMKQYEDKYNDFYYLGTLPIDFMEKDQRTDYCIVDQICKFTVHDLKKRKKMSFASVINFDEHFLPGSHWVAMYANIDPEDKRFGIFYYDSYGNKPPVRIRNFMNDIKKDVNMSSFKINYNKIRHQYQNNECGTFSMTFIILCLENDEKITKTLKNKLKPRSDELIRQYRRFLFIPKTINIKN